jgi:hypothetical protein
VLATRLKTGIAKGKSVVILRLSCNRSDFVDAAAIIDDEEDENKRGLTEWTLKPEC